VHPPELSAARPGGDNARPRRRLSPNRQVAHRRRGIDAGELSVTAKADALAFRKAKAVWAAKIDPILAHGTIQSSELDLVRTATEVFYRAYGERFE
jgi:hypothetical protein